MTKAIAYDSAEFLTDDVAIREYMNEALATNDAGVIAHAVGVVARARNMASIARKTGLARGSLYRALSSEGKPELATVLKVLNAVGITLTANLPAAPVRRADAKTIRTAKSPAVTKGGIIKIGTARSKSKAPKVAKAAKRVIGE